MAKGDKNYDKVVRGVNKGQKAEKKKKAIHKMIESLITGDSESAAEQLHAYLQLKTRELILGEAEDEKEKDEDEKEESDEDEKEESDEDEKDESDEDEKEDSNEEEK